MSFESRTNKSRQKKKKFESLTNKLIADTFGPQKMQKQAKFKDPLIKMKDSYGGSLRKSSKNRSARPISSKEPMHLILKSSKAKGQFSFGYGKNPKRIKEIIDQHCRRYGVKLIEYSNNFNHLHMLVKFPSRAIYLRFIRSLTGHLVLAVARVSKLKALKEIFGKTSFWDYRPFTRVIRGWRGFKIASDYVVLNKLEAIGIVPKRDGRLKDVLPSEHGYFRENRGIS